MTQYKSISIILLMLSVFRIDFETVSPSWHTDSKIQLEKHFSLSARPGQEKRGADGMRSMNTSVKHV